MNEDVGQDLIEPEISVARGAGGGIHDSLIPCIGFGVDLFFLGHCSFRRENMRYVTFYLKCALQLPKIFEARRRLETVS